MSLQIIQLTDLHLFADAHAELKGIRTNEQFERVLEVVEREYRDADLLVLTGDLTHDEREETYSALRERLVNWLPRLRLIPGNHDDREVMRRVFANRGEVTSERIAFSSDLGGWRLIGLDSHRPGELSGELGTAQLEWLDQQLSAAPDRPTGVFVHHPPVTINSPWLDRISLLDARPLFELLRRHTQIRFISCGHVHQERTALTGMMPCFTTPATGVQFRPETETLEVDSVPPAFRVFELNSDGSLQTRVERVREVANP